VFVVGCLGVCPVLGWPPAPLLPVAADETPGALPPSVTAEAAGTGKWRCTFQARVAGSARSMGLAGTFNGWNPRATPMSGPDAQGMWAVQVDLPSGKHRYKFVADGNRWFHDPRNVDKEPDGHAGFNSILRLGRVAHLRRSAAKVADGKIEALALEHDPDRPQYFQRLPDRRALIRLRTLAHDVAAVHVAVADGGRFEMVEVSTREPFATWEAIAAFPANKERDIYTFVMKDGTLERSGPATYGVPVGDEAVFRTPDWAKHAVWYQIMMDRFRNGDASNDPNPVHPWTSDWFKPVPWEGKDGATFYKYYVFDRLYGGDLAGLLEKLPYLKDLGINAIYLNPVFKADSHHKYNASTYLHIDDHFGVKGDYEVIKDKEDHTDPSTWVWTKSDRQFLDFLKKTHAMGMKVIIDGVFNHVGTAHPAFQDVKKNGRNSRYADWFEVTSWDPFEYEGWFGHGELPVFRKSPDGLASEEVKEYIYNVTKRWMDPDGDGDPGDGIDGWRLDVPNEIPAPFWVGWREHVKSINPDAYITGEIWERADEWLDGKHFDAVMNYEFARGACGWVFNVKQKISPSELDRRYRELRMAYPREATLVLQNLMNSHDTDRVASMALNPDRPYDDGNRVQDNGPDYNNDKPSPTDYRKARLTLLMQMTYVGAPMVYYGDEVGMWGADDPTCRKPMLWRDLEPYENPDENHVMDDHLAFYKRAIALRNAHPALRTGSFQTLLTDDEQDVWAFLRRDPNEQLIVALNASDKDATVVVPLPRNAPRAWRGVFNLDETLTARENRLRVHVPAIGGVVLHAATPK
jgi:glycosidase